ncbi:MAG: biotin/lipoyl-containing protein [Bacteroidota bacterium]
MTEALLESFSFAIASQAQTYHAQGSEQEMSLTELGPKLWSFELAGKAYRVFLEGMDVDKKILHLKINGKPTSVQLRDRADRLISALGMEDVMTKKISEVRAPMPGLIHSVMVASGQEVAQGDPLLILEAMKMENVIKSPADGQVSNIHIQPSDSVEKNALLISFA